ncbi:metalloregulator ArsR/SmtB family transcription factor [Salinicola salarius]|uniref:metalloregulator ArsR/SmtB family transcription factor n=1 Tax=Salinicola salarius TaxID=430457 RepID=UPI0026EB5003|nr:metalloregulator ArsR/SmtB family transcription factor [Salinicola salarius]
MPALSPAQLFKCLGDETRLALSLLIYTEGELCVCEMTHALQQPQPKISRHLAQLRACDLLQDRRQGQWVHYRLMPDLPNWVLATLDEATAGASSLMGEARDRLAAMGNRPARQTEHC